MTADDKKPDTDPIMESRPENNPNNSEKGLSSPQGALSQASQNDLQHYRANERQLRLISNLQSRIQNAQQKIRDLRTKAQLLAVDDTESRRETTLQERTARRQINLWTSQIRVIVEGISSSYKEPPNEEAPVSAQPAETSTINQQTCPVETSVPNNLDKSSLNMSRAATNELTVAVFFKKSSLYLTIIFMLAAFYFYWGIYSSSRFVSSASFHIQSDGDKPVISPLESLGITGPTNNDPNRKLLDFVISMDCMQAVAASNAALQYWKDKNIDAMSRLSPDANTLEQLNYWRSMVRIRLDDITQLLVLDVESFTPDSARAIATDIIKECKALTNRLSSEILRSKNTYLELELAKSASELDEATIKLLDFQRRNASIDLESVTLTDTSAIMEMKRDLEKEVIELAAISTKYSENSESVRSQRGKIQALHQAIDKAEERLFKGTGSSKIYDLLVEQQKIKSLLKLREDIYTATLLNYRKNQSELRKDMWNVAIVSGPTQQDAPSYPNVVRNMLAAAIVTIITIFVFRAVILTLREFAE